MSERQNAKKLARARAMGVISREEHLAKFDATRPARTEAKKRKARLYQHQPATKAKQAKHMREKRAAMPLEERRALWRKHTDAKRERDRAAKKKAAA